MEEHKIGSYCRDDASKWAKAFCQIFPDTGVDEDTMMGWFANAIEISHDVRMAKSDSEAK